MKLYVKDLSIRYVAKNIAIYGYADVCEIQVVYAIGKSKHNSMFIDTKTSIMLILKYVKLLEFIMEKIIILRYGINLIKLILFFLLIFVHTNIGDY